MVMFELWIIRDKCLIQGCCPIHTQMSNFPLLHQPVDGKGPWAYLSSSSLERAISLRCQTRVVTFRWSKPQLLYLVEVIIATIIFPYICRVSADDNSPLTQSVSAEGTGLTHSICREEREIIETWLHLVGCFWANEKHTKKLLPQVSPEAAPSEWWGGLSLTLLASNLSPGWW